MDKMEIIYYLYIQLKELLKQVPEKGINYLGRKVWNDLKESWEKNGKHVSKSKQTLSLWKHNLWIFTKGQKEITVKCNI